MRHRHSLDHLGKQFQSERNPTFARSGWGSLKSLATVAIAFAAVSAYAFQDSPALHAVTRGGPSHSAPVHKQQGSTQKSQGGDVGLDVEQYKPLMEELGHLQEKLVQGVQFPAPRTQSRLLPLLPPSSSFFLAVPNYGEALNQASQIFHQELQESSVLSDFWRAKVGMGGLIADQVIEKLHQLFQFLGDEIVVTGTVTPKSASVLLIAEARKPGLKAFIQELVGQYASKTKPPVVVYTPQQLALATKQRSDKPLLVLVRSDYVVASSDLASLRSFNAQLNRGGARFASGGFGEKIAQQYQDGAAMVFGADLHQLLNLRPRNDEKGEALLRQSGFGDVKYLVGKGQFVGGIASSNAELSFAGPRKGVAAWLGTPAPLTALDFISPNASYAGAFNLVNFGQIFDDVRNFATSSNPGAGQGLEQMQEMLKIRLKEDLFSKLSGQIAVALDGPIMPTPAWKMVAQLSDANGLERTLKQLIALAGTNLPPGIKVEQETEGGVNYYGLSVPGGEKPVEVTFAFTDGFLVVAASREGVKEAIRTHRSGNSLARSTELQDLLPSQGSNAASGILYQNLGQVFASMGQQVPPEQAQLFEMMSRYGKPSAATLIGSDDAIRVTSRSHGIDATMPLIIAAVAIPNLMRSKNAANEAAAASNVRTLISAESTYQYTYAKYAPDLATLGPHPNGGCESGPSENHACVIDSSLSCATKWCSHYGFRFNITGQCSGQMCGDYVIVATPADPNQGRKSYCATSDGVIRSQQGPPLRAPISVAECQSWQPL